MANLGLDYAGSPPGAAAVKAAGYQFVMRYLSRYTDKVIKKPEFDNCTQNGVSVGLVFEDYANQALQGYSQGVSDAQFALSQASALGWPNNRPIYFAVDFDINDSQKPAAGEYMKGAISVLGLQRVGAYGGYYWIKYCVDNNLASYFWQAVAWSGGNKHPANHLFQRLGGVNVNGTSCDVNEALQTNFGQWPTEGVTMDDKDITAMYLAAGKSEKDATLQANLDYYRGKKPEQLANDLYKGNSTNGPNNEASYFYRASHYDADVAAAGGSPSVVVNGKPYVPKA